MRVSAAVPILLWMQAQLKPNKTPSADSAHWNFRAVNSGGSGNAGIAEATTSSAADKLMSGLIRLKKRRAEQRALRKKLKHIENLGKEDGADVNFQAELKRVRERLISEYSLGSTRCAFFCAAPNSAIV